MGNDQKLSRRELIERFQGAAYCVVYCNRHFEHVGPATVLINKQGEERLAADASSRALRRPAEPRTTGDRKVHAERCRANRSGRATEPGLWEGGSARDHRIALA